MSLSRFATSYKRAPAANALVVDADRHYATGDTVPWHFIPSIIVASFFASLSGTLLTVELLQRKRLGKSLMSRVHLFACSVSMGLIGIWCMHFIGNRSISLGNGESRLQLVYNPGYTGLSCVLPVLGLTVVFQIAEISINSFVFRRLLDTACGLMAGLSIVSMHYVGNLGASNYTLTYPKRYLVAACIIAVGDSTIALALFFHLKERWINVLWKRFLCALLLAVGVCGMHFTASIGCRYELKRVPSEEAPNARNIPVIVAATMCFVAAVSCLMILFYVQYRNTILANRAQHMMLACAYFDEHGNIMVTNEGTLPSQRIAKRFVIQKFDDHFGIHHPVFFWIWKVSNDWASVMDLIPRMRAHLHRTSVYSGQNTATSSRSSIYDEESYHDSTILFREGYCVAAADLAEQLQKPLDQIGPLYDQVLGTGLLTAYQNGIRTLDNGGSQQSAIFEKGQLLFYARRLTCLEMDHYIAAGFRFAPFNRVESVIANTMQIPVGLLAIQMQRVQDYAYRVSVPSPPKQGTYFVCFAALARIRDSFRVLVPLDRQDDLPDVQVSPHNLNTGQLDYLKRYTGWTAERVIRDLRLKEQNWDVLEDGEEKAFIIMLRTALASLTTKLGERWLMDLVFCAEPTMLRYGATKAQRDGMTMVFGFTRLVDIHQPARKLPAGLTLANWDLVRMRQHYYPGCNDHGRIRREIHAEFGPLLTKHEAVARSEDRRVKSRKISRTRSALSEDSDVLKPDSWLEGGHLEARRGSIDSIIEHSQPWGGILATTNTVIEGRSKSGIELRNLTPQVTAGASATLKTKEPKTYVDCLYEQAKSHACRSMC
ncbi:hypothetical protein M438DRAFT_312624 [Aureobasidium pullulans EXF-150]|uniref:MHYT domain-containing protein n=1 Tax=Aureobasidium pullulans EXF-150 TaxID=1043002 RepID=A0A074YLJ9_AURPU|nr:uncharacterized protein M438DRAFT_312624 [Aureobasidium pullulans EXF-150]KEQ87756.1 hypothetical protein M438DRAFT_312624 [Aureobasidium pullulans EXF-150]